jgi:PTS system N-acetylglucosamine-specific IIC component
MSAPAPAPARAEHDAAALLAALGGRANVTDLETAAGRLLIRTARPESIDEAALAKLGIRGVAHSAADRVQVLVAGVAEEWAGPLRRLLATS